MIDLPENLSRGELARLIPVTADSNKEQPEASIFLAALRGEQVGKRATLLLEQEEIESDDQHFVLEEVNRYLSHDSSGISGFDRMNPEWKDVVGHVKSGATLSKNSEEVINTVTCWHQEQRDLCLGCSAGSGSRGRSCTRR